MRTIKKYFTLAEHAKITEIFPTEGIKPYYSSELKWSYLIPDMPSSAAWINIDATLSKLLNEYIWPEFYQEAVEVETVEVPDWANVEDQDIQLSDETRLRTSGKFYAWLNQTYPKYKKLLDLYESQENNLLKQLESSSKTLFNDTPQAGGDFTSDPYITNATQVSASTDTATPIARLKEVQDNIVNYYKKWADEFEKFIIYSA